MEGYTCQWFFNEQLSEGFKVDKRCYDFEQSKTEFEIQLWTNDVIAQMYKILLKLGREEEQE